MATHRITLLDNQEYTCHEDQAGGQWLQSRDGKPIPIPKTWRERKPWLELEQLLQKSLAQNSVLVVRDEDTYEHTTTSLLESQWGPDGNAVIRTGNLIGCLQYNRVTLEISSRFGTDFLKYLIADADGFLPIADLGGKTDTPEGYHWLLAFLWSIKLTHAYRLGMPKEYHSEQAVLHRVRGELSPVKYLLEGPLGKWSCTYREQSFDTMAAALLVTTYRLLQSSPDCAPFCQPIHGIYLDFLQAIHGKSPKRKELLKTRHFTNAFYSEYNDVIDLSKKILQFWGSDTAGTDTTPAIFFDVAMLFECHIRKLLQRNGFTVLGKNQDYHHIPTCPLIGDFQRKLIPDLVLEADGNLCVFDVKYKYYDSIYGISREDLFQLHTYIGQYGNRTPVKACGFIYPIKESRWRKLRQDQDKVAILSELEQQGRKIRFAVFFLVVPDNLSGPELSSFDSLKTSMDHWTKCFLSQMNELCLSH